MTTLTKTMLTRLALAVMLAGPLQAQMHEHAMGDAGAHLRVTPPHAPTSDDSARAAALLATLRAAIEKYRDVRVAEADGFRMFAPKLRRQRVYHYTDRRAALLAMFRFDPARPTSLLYQPQPDGTLELIGAMYTAPRWATLDELDARVPLSVAEWHQHVNICVPPWRERDRMLEVRDGRPVFGPGSPIATRDACEAVGGRFRAQAFGWMVHVNAFAEDPAAVWGESHRHAAMAAMADSFPGARGSSPMP